MTRIERWERAAEWPLIVAAVLFLAAYALPIVLPDLPQAWRSACSVVLALTWAAFAIDYGARLALSSERWTFVKRNLLDLAVIALPVLRPLRLLRLVALVAILNRAGANSLRGRVVLYVITGTALLVLCGGLAITDAERGQPGANIAGPGDGLWWAMTTMTTVGYGDRFPTTVTGRFVAVALMISGIAVLGVVTATLASWLVERVARANEDEQAATRAQVKELAAEVRALRELLESGGVRAAQGPTTAT